MSVETDSLLTGTDLNLQDFQLLFKEIQDTPFRVVEVDATNRESLKSLLVVPIRRCYATDEFIQSRAIETNLSQTEVLESKLPDPGATMAGDFGEILAFLFHQSVELPKVLIGPKKWQLKQDRKKPAPHSDVLHFHLPSWPNASEYDELLCSEVKMKSTSSASSPISSAISGCENDRTGRLGKTLAWLKERAIGENLVDISIGHIERFLKPVEYPACRKRYFAIAIICNAFCDDELDSDPPKIDPSYTFFTIKITDLHALYNGVFDAVRQSVLNQDAGSVEGTV